MIGPHQGKELELMLSGKKHLALFYDVFTDGKENFVGRLLDYRESDIVQFIRNTRAL